MTQVIGITGKKFHGKDSAARELTLHGFRIERFAGPLKAMLTAFYKAHGMTDADIYRRIEGDLKEAPCSLLQGKSPRYAMQTLGTEWGRDLIGENLWTDSLKVRCSGADKVAVPDVRFPNEAAVVNSLKGKIWRIDASKRVPDNEHSNHKSEQEINAIPADLEVDNNGTPFELAATVRAALSISA